MQLLKYNKKFTFEPFGLNNMGATCYWNAIFQSLISCTSLMETLKNNDVKNNNILSFMKKIQEILYIQTGQYNSKLLPLLNKSSSFAWKMMFDKSQKRKDNVLFTSGQQCASEGFYLFLDMLDDVNFTQLFEHRISRDIKCGKCNNIISKIREEYSTITIDINEEEKKEEKEFNIKKHIQGHYDVVKDFKCKICSDTSDKKRKNTFVMVPEILVVMLKRYNNNNRKLNHVIKLPEIFTLDTGNKERKIKYKAVSQIEHSGGTGSGHYWAICKRKDKWYNLNDSSISPSKFETNSNTYIIFYHVYQ